MFLEEPLWSELSMIAYGNLLIVGYLYDFAFARVLTCVLHEALEAVEVADCTVDHRALRCDFLVSAHYQEDYQHELQVE